MDRGILVHSRTGKGREAERAQPHRSARKGRGEAGDCLEKLLKAMILGGPGNWDQASSAHRARPKDTGGKWLVTRLLGGIIASPACNNLGFGETVLVKRASLWPTWVVDDLKNNGQFGAWRIEISREKNSASNYGRAGLERRHGSFMEKTPHLQ